MRDFMVKNLLLHVLILFAVFCMVLCSCGFKGPLYLPKKPVASQPIKAAISPTAVKANTGTIAIPTESGTLTNESSVMNKE